MKWDESMCQEIEGLIGAGMTYPEIATLLGVSRATIAVAMLHRGILNKNYLKRITKHKHLHYQVLRFFKNHDWNETRDRFNLTDSELKSLFTYAYRNPDLKYLRKDSRRKDKWTSDELRTLLKWAGILSRKEIAKIAGRGNDRVIKEKLQSLGVASRNINGMNITQFRNTFGDLPVRVVRTIAGPPRRNHFTQVLWVDLEEMINNREIRPSALFKKTVAIMATFQRWIWGNANIHNEISTTISKMIKRPGLGNAWPSH